MKSRLGTLRMAVCSLVSILMIIGIGTKGAWAIDMGTAFTYQGELKDAGTPVEDTCDFEFTLWDDAMAGSQIGPTVSGAVTITAGRFTTALDFGTGVFTGQARWLEIGVCCPSPCAPSFTPLTRQELRPAPHALALRNDAVTSATVLDGTIASSDLAPNSVNATAIASNAVTSGDIGDGGILNIDLGPDCVTSNKIMDSTITAMDLANDSVDSAEILASAVGTSEIADGTIGNADLGPDCVTSAKIMDGTISAMDLASGSVESAEIASNAVISAKIADGTVANIDLGPDCVTSAKIMDGTITAMDLGPDSVAASEIAGDAVGSAEIAPDAVGSSEIGGNSVGNSELISDAASLNKVSGGAMTASGSNVGIGDATPVARLDVEQAGATVAIFNRSNDGVVVSIQRAGVEEGTIMNIGGVVTYTPFTGSHLGWTQEAMERGLLVVMTGKNKPYHGSENGEPIYGITPSTTANDPRCLGAYLGLLESERPADLSNPHLIMAVGNGAMWVVDEGRNIKAGDYLISSDMAGHAMLDDEARFEVGHVIARAAEPVDWSEVKDSFDGQKHKQISVFFENFTRGNSTLLGRTVEAQRQVVAEQQRTIADLQSQLATHEHEINDLKQHLARVEALLAANRSRYEGSAR